MPHPQINLKVSPLTQAELIAIKKLLEADKQRQVSYSETIDELALAWRQARLERDVKAAG